MNLPVRIQSEAGTERVLSVDGAFGAPGLNLSHWPGNTTPADLKHDLSAGIALKFARLDEADRARRAEGCVALVNNHYDTDGLCAMLAVLEPEFALAHEGALLDAAWAGDFFRRPSEAAFAIDCVVSAAADPERSPFAADLSGLDDHGQRELATHRMLELLPALVGGELEPYADLWRPACEDALDDARDLDTCSLDDLVHLDYVVWTAPGAGGSARRNARTERFDPGRHALFERSHADRQLVVARTSGGTTFRFLIGTASFFDLVSRKAQPRPDLAALAAELNGLEGTAAGASVAWRHQPQTGASPELWFGTGDLALYAEHAGEHLRPSGLDPERVKRAVVDGLRATWVFPDEEDDPQEENDHLEDNQPPFLFTVLDERLSAAPSLLLAGDAADPVAVVRSSFWGYNSIGVSDGDEACVIDPGIYPEDIALLAETLTARPGCGPPRSVTRVLLTHSHHDHIRGWMRFPGARVAFPRAAAEKAAGACERILAAKSIIDEKLEITDPGFAYPRADDVFDERLPLTVGELELEMRFLPGHSDCTSVVWIPSTRTLCTADYFVSPGLPYCRWEAAAFEDALDTLAAWVEEEDVERVLPSHNAPLHGAPAILAAIKEEKEYFAHLRRLVRAGLAAGQDHEACARHAAAAMDVRRVRSVGPRSRQDVDNARRVIAEEAAEPSTRPSSSGSRPSSR